MSVLSLALLLDAPVYTALAQSAPTPTAGTQQLHGHLSAAMKQAPFVARLELSTQLHLAISLPLRNQSQLTASLAAIYDRNSPQYHHYLTPEQFAAGYGASEQDYQAVVAFARAKGLTVEHAFGNRLLVAVTGTSDNVERAFHVTRNKYKRPDESMFHAPDREPSLDLSTPVLYVSGLENYILPRPPLRVSPLGQCTPTPLIGSAPLGLYGGNDFRNAYAPSVALNGAGQCVGLVEFDGFYANDIATYRQQFNLPNVPITTVLLNSFSGSPGTYNGEVAADIDMAIAMAPGLSSVVVVEGTNVDSVLGELAMPTQNEPLCKQLSASWIFPTDPNSTQLFEQMARQGQSFFAGAGDAAAYTSDPGDDRDQPDITFVGGTVLSMNGSGTSWQSETAWSGGGGGILTSVTIPSYQSAVNMTTNYGSTQHRDLPDVAMVAYDVFLIASNGTVFIAGGTSVATPLWASFMALVNQRAAACGLNPVGFANPALYAIGQNAGKYAADFHDIQSGNNGSPTKYPAVAGYDLATGWGGPQANLIDELSPQTPACTPGAPTNLNATPQ